MAKPTRSAPAMEPLHIYQDDMFDHAAPIVSHAPMPTNTAGPRKALQPANQNTIINPQSTSAPSKPGRKLPGQSPLKPRKRQNNTPLNPLNNPLQPSTGNGSRLNMVSIQPPPSNGHHTDSMEKKAPVMSRFKTASQKPQAPAMSSMSSMSFMDPSVMGKENAHPTIYPAPPTPSQFNIPLDHYYQNPLGKRVLMEAAPIKDPRPQKKIKLETDINPPTHASFPHVKDDGQKPPHSYATLIGMAILRSPHGRLTLSQIYKSISDTYSFYNPNDAGWQNSIRHNLSLCKAFDKEGRPKGDKGKGNYWVIVPGMEAQFMKEKPSKKSHAAAAAAAATSLNSDGNSGAVMDRPQPRAPPALQESSLPAPPAPPAPKAVTPKLPEPNSTANASEPSSDATIPCPISELAAPDEPVETKLEFEANLDCYSHLHAAIHSSPPIPKHINNTTLGGTPPPTMKAPGSSISRSHKRKFASMDDSGYISSLESSAMRRSNTSANMMLTSEPDRPRSKRGLKNELGTAEAEIRRIRASSCESPTKGRSHGLMPSSSSPYGNDSGQMLPPLTPAMKMRAPVRPPPSVSPDTSLRIHRAGVDHMVDSPLRRASVLGEEPTPWSPAFNLDFMNNPDLDVSQDLLCGPNSDAWSPVKRSVKKVRVDRFQSTGALGDITNSTQRKSITSAPVLTVPSHDSPHVKFETPSKAMGQIDSLDKTFAFESPSRLPLGDENSAADWMFEAGDFQGYEFLTDDLISSELGVDILQGGFEKIGAAPSHPQPPPQVSTPTPQLLQPRR